MLNEHTTPNGAADPQFESLVPAIPVGRRGFLAASASIVGFALAAGPVQAQSVITTSADGLDTTDLQIPTSDGRSMPGYMASPKTARRHATIIVIPEVFGMHEYQKDICRRLAKVGYVGVTLDPFFRIGDLSKVADIKEVIAGANKLEDRVMLGDLDSLVAMLEKNPKVNAAKLGITGMCRGGRTVWMYTAHSKKIKAGVSWYGGLNPAPPAMTQTPHDVVATLNGPVLGLYAGADAGIPTHQVARLQEALKNGSPAAKASTFILYPAVPHAFHADYRPTYRKTEAEDGWQRMLAWFRQHGVA
jgi:carboxymethylenebutenolidase